MKKWILIETVGDMFETVLKAKTKEAAIEEAKIKWSKLSDYDKRRRKEAFIVYAELDEDGDADLNTAAESINLLSE